jgi:hypothetical protein
MCKFHHVTNRVSALMKKNMSVTHNSSTQHVIWAKSGAERPHSPFTCEPGINVDIEVPRNPLEYFDLFCIPEIVEVIARGANQCAKIF